MGSRAGLNVFGEEKIVFFMPAFEPRIVQSVAYSLHSLRHSGVHEQRNHHSHEHKQKHSHFTFKAHTPNVSLYLVVSSYATLDVAISNLDNPAGWIVLTTMSGEDLNFWDIIS